MKTTIKITDFRFQPSGYGHIAVTYTSPVTGTKWSTITDNMQLIDRTNGSDNPTQKDLNELKRLCRR